ncbi:hypothetical protein [Priestia megaterium]|uniref:hypothetical protein n=1 Tax=Priestia megaterium TaxID=1404 RepID=UPI00211D5B8F|nr:hypothetical protein [Priestia megaterium]
MKKKKKKIKRKYMSEFGLHTFSSYVEICYPLDLKSLTFEHDYHIYMINLIPKLSFNKLSLKVFEDYVSIDVNIKTEESSRSVNIPFTLAPNVNHKELNISIDRPSKTLTMLNNEGDGAEIRVLSLLQFARIWLDTEILYIGQSYGKKGERKAIDRLISHNTLQKIQSDFVFDPPERDLAITFFEFTPRLMASFDGITKEFEKNDKEDLIHFNNIMGNEPLKLSKPMISITEAALINYFKPPYNQKFRDNFPRLSHGSYKQYYDLDYNALTVELDPDAIRTNFFSENQKYNTFKAIKYTLHSEEHRRSMFDFFTKDNSEVN